MIYRQEGPARAAITTAAAIVQGRDGNLFISAGEHFTGRDMAQTLDYDLGKIVRIAPRATRRRTIPSLAAAARAPWSILWPPQSAGADASPESGDLWEQEHGAMGGDEVNIIKPARIRLAARQPWRQLRWQQGRYRTAEGRRHRRSGLVLDALDRALGPDVLHRQPVPAVERQLFNGALKFQLLSRLEIKDGSR